MHKRVERVDLDQGYPYPFFMAGRSPKEETQLDEFEKSQAALRESIEQSKRLADKSQQLLDQHRRQSDGAAK